MNGEMPGEDLRVDSKMEKKPRAWRTPAIVVLGAGIFLAVMVTWRPSAGRDLTERELVDRHLKALMSDHLVDFPSADPSAVNQWLQGKVESTPVVPDLSKAGFVLVGGRSDTIGGHPAGVLVYKQDAHVVNLWIVRGVPISGDAAGAYHGFNVIRWSDGSATNWAVSDLKASGLTAFVAAVRGR